MIPVTPETKNALHQAVKQIRAQISWATSATETQTITSEDQLVSMKKEAEGYYCKSTLRKITVVVAGTNLNLLDKKITAQVQVKTGANAWGTISWGSFTITEAKVDEDKGSSTFTGYGGIALLQAREYSTGELSFPTTVGGLARQVADKFGIVLNPELKILPDEYQQVEYIKSTTTQWIDTGVLPAEADEVDADITLDAHNSTRYSIFIGGNYEQVITSGNTTRYCPLLAYNESGSTDIKIGVGFINNGWEYGTALWELGARKRIKSILRSGDIRLYVDGELTLSSTQIREPAITNVTMPLLSYQYRANRLRNYGWNGKIYSLTLSKNGTKVRDFVPCRRKSDSKPGLFDLVSGEFYTNAGTGEFTLGADTENGVPTIYRRLDYLEATATNRRIDTGLTWNSETSESIEITMDAQCLGITNSSIVMIQRGETPSAANWAGAYKTKWGCNSADLYDIPCTTRVTQIAELTADSVITTINGVQKTRTNVANNGKIYLGCAASYATTYRMYSAKIKENGVMVRDLIPCQRKNDSKVGYYDTITGAFYTAMTGDFVAGTEAREIPNLDALITEDLWANISGTTYRDILEEIAGATGTIAVIGGGDDTLDLHLPPIEEASETLTENNLITAKIGEDWGKVSSVVLSRQPQNDNVEATDQTIANEPSGKNLFGFSRGTIAKYPATGLNVTSTETSVLIESDTTTGAQAYGVILKLDPTKTYVASAKAKKIVKGTDGQPRINLGVMGALTPTGSWTSVGTGGSVTDPTEGTEYSIEHKGLTGYEYYRFYFYNNTSTPVSIGEKTEYWDIQLEEGSQATPYEAPTTNGVIPLVIANNEILDKQRETTAQPILDAVKGWEYRNAEIKTEGHGYHEIGDRLDLTVGGATYPTIVTKSTIQIDGGIKETLVSATPEVIPIDYSKSGGITKTVFRTELTVDKQGQEIESIVSRQDATDAAVQEQFTQVTQNLTNIIATVQSTGGGNIIKNSVGYGKDADGILTIWQYGSGADATTVRSQSSPASLNAGAQAGYEIMMTGASTISQPVELTPGEKYTLALRAQKGATGSATITVGNSSESQTITLAANTAYTWQRQSVEFTPTMGANTVTITAAAGTTVEITDLILATGGAMTWRQASSEIYNTQVSLDQDGVQVRSSVYTGDYVEITPLEFAGWSNASGTMQKVFTLNRDTTEVEKLEARSQIKMPPLKIVPINSTTHSGWAFVKED